MSGLTVDAASKELAVEHFIGLWNSRSKLEWRYEAPPQPRRPNTAPQAASAIEHDAISYRRLCQRFHSDLVGTKKKFTADEVLAIINELRDSARPKS
jgi:hypothetical protein